ncbi:MAG TPA: PAS domain S-box protein [Syntrophales bacterium]|nr:PAS domain S-box protein [Syntrophales bacterium]
MGNHTGGKKPAIRGNISTDKEQVFDIVEYLPDATFIIDKQQKVIAWNKAAEKLTGISKESILGKGDYAYAVPFYGVARPILIDLFFYPHLKLEDRYTSIKKRKHFLYGEGHAPALTGRKAAYFSAVAAPLTNAEGELTGAIECIRNITDQKLADNALKQSEERYRKIVETAAEGIWVMDDYFRTTFVNARMAAMLQYDVQEMDGRTLIDFMFAEDLPDHAEKITRRWKGQAHQYERRLRRKDGTEIHTLVSSTPLRERGRLIGSLSMFTDITAWKQNEQAAMDNLERFQALFENMKSGVVIYQARNNGKDFVIVNMNQAAKMIEKVDKTVIGKSVVAAFPGVKTFGLFEVLRRVYRTGKAEAYPATFYEDKRVRGWRENYVFKLPSGEVVAVYDDVTPQKKAEAALRDSEERFRNTFEQAAVGIAHLDLRGAFLRVNQRYCDICGYSAEELLPKTFQQITHSEDLEIDLQQARRLARNEIQTSAHEKRYLRKDGSVIWVNVTASLARSPDGKPLYFISVVEDISKRKDAEYALRQSEEKYRSIVENAVEGIFQCAPGGRIISINLSMARMHGYDSQQDMTVHAASIGKQLFANPQEWSSFRRFIKSSGIIRNFETQTLHKNDKIIWVLINARAVKTTEGRILFFEGTVEDITQRKKGEDALRRYRLLSENTREIILFIGKDGKILDGNQAAVLTYGYDRETLLSLSIFDLRAPYLHEGLQKDLQRINEENVVIETEHIRRDGTVFPVEVSARSVTMGKEQVFLSIIRDITERKRTSDAIVQVMERLRKATGCIIDVIVNAVELRDPYTSGHQRRVANLARAIATEMHLPSGQIDGIRMAGVVHDVGKISIPAEILSMPRKLTDIEYELVKTHAEAGYQMLKDIDFPWPLADIVRQHHERYNGTGYPLGLKGDEILIEARIIACADVVEAIASHRPYRPSVGIDAALREIEDHQGVFYDPAVVTACLRLFREKGFQLS